MTTQLRALLNINHLLTVGYQGVTGLAFTEESNGNIRSTLLLSVWIYFCYSLLMS